MESRTGKGLSPGQAALNIRGTLVDGKRTGKGIYTWSDGMKYKGDWVNDKPTGKGLSPSKTASKYAADDAKEISKEALPVKKKIVKKKGREMRVAIHYRLLSLQGKG